LEWLRRCYLSRPQAQFLSVGMAIQGLLGTVEFLRQVDLCVGAFGLRANDANAGSWDCRVHLWW